MKIQKITAHGFEEVLRYEDPSLSLIAFIAIHSTRLGPALGGIRMFPYESEANALEDVKRLAQAMSFKAAASELKLGGGKAVILGDPAKDKSPERLRSMGCFVNHLQGKYYAAKDAGIITEDLTILAEKTQYVTGLPESLGGSGDPSPWTAVGILEGIRSSLAFLSGKKDLKGATVSIQGLGHVGNSLAELLFKNGAALIVTDTNQKALMEAKKWQAKTVLPEQIFETEAAVFSPCALGGVLNQSSIPKLKCKIVAGGANNQLLDEEKDGQSLHGNEILFAPDYVLNAGGLINIYVKDILKQKNSMPWIQKIGERLRHIYEISTKRNLPTITVANEMTGNLLRG